MAHILAVVCDNGLGHFRRTTALLARLRQTLPDARIDLVCERGKVEWANRWGRDGDLRTARANFIDLKCDAPSLAWETRLARFPEVATADLILSDNLAGVLSVRPDAVLVGSFLWSDVLHDVNFVAHERELLSAHRPPMLCVRDLVMPGVRERTRAVPVSWMCEPAATRPEGRPQPPWRVGVAGGATHAADAALAAAAKTLRQSGRCEDVSLPRATAEFIALDAVLCRPGVGTLTECVAHAVPVVTLYEEGNAELEHNGRRIEELGFGRNLGVDPSGDVVVAALDALCNPTESRRVRARLAAAAKDGLDQAAHWLMHHGGFSH